MLRVDIPQRQPYELEHLLLDLNGTIAVDGRLIDGVAERLARLSERLEPYVITADTQGRATELGAQLGVKVTRLRPGQEAEQKMAFVRRLGARATVAIGNGANDALMLREAAIGVAVLGEEGLAMPTLRAADVVVPGICAALDLLLKPKRLVATLRA